MYPFAAKENLPTYLVFCQIISVFCVYLCLGDTEEVILVHGRKDFEVCEFVFEAACVNKTGSDVLHIGGPLRFVGIYGSTEVFVSYGGDVVAYVDGDAPERSAFF